MSGTVEVLGETHRATFSGPSKYFILSRNTMTDLCPNEWYTPR